MHWKILHLTDFFTQPAVVMVVTNMKYAPTPPSIGWKIYASIPFDNILTFIGVSENSALLLAKDHLLQTYWTGLWIWKLFSSLSDILHNNSYSVFFLKNYLRRGGGGWWDVEDQGEKASLPDWAAPVVLASTDWNNYSKSNPKFVKHNSKFDGGKNGHDVENYQKW